MNYNSTKHIGILLNNSSIGAEVNKKLQQLEQIKSLVSSFLPKNLAENCIVSNLRSGVLVILTNSPVWKYQLNFLKMDLLEKLRSSSPLLAGISSISIIISYFKEEFRSYNSLNYSSSKITKNKNFMISKSNAVLVNEVIEQEIKDENLKIKFKQLISKLKQ